MVVRAVLELLAGVGLMLELSVILELVVGAFARSVLGDAHAARLREKAPTKGNRYFYVRLRLSVGVWVTRF